jgi:hypothetical protein
MENPPLSFRFDQSPGSEVRGAGAYGTSALALLYSGRGRAEFFASRRKVARFSAAS